jgi:hypothetical protein
MKNVVRFLERKIEAGSAFDLRETGADPVSAGAIDSHGEKEKVAAASEQACLRPTLAAAPSGVGGSTELENEGE